MRIVNLSQGTPKWLDWRRLGLGSTDISALIGMNPYKTPFQVWEDKMGISFPIVQNEAMKAGTDAEPFIRDDFNLYMGTNHNPLCVESIKYPFLRGSLDGWDKETNSILEIKYSKYSKMSNCVKKNDINHLTELYQQYVCQMNYFMYLMKSDKCTLATYDMEGTLVYMNVPRDEKLINEMVKAGKKFYEEHIATCIPPKKGKHDYITIDEPKALSIAKELEEIKRKIKLMSEREKALKEALVEFSDDLDFTCGNLEVSRVNSNRVNTKKLYEDFGIDEDVLKKYRQESIGFWRILIGK